jgi:hydroxylamine dehydrogenase
MPAQARIWDSVPDEQLQALQLSREACQVVRGPVQALQGRLEQGQAGQYWEPIPMDMYLAPSLFYKPPDVNIDVTREQCVSCHTSVTHGWVKSWEKSVHANLDAIRQLPASDVRAYKKDIIAEVEDNLRGQGLLARPSR